LRDHDAPSIAERVGGPLIFGLGGLASLGWFTVQLYILLSSFSDQIITFDKSAFYFLGVGGGLVVLAYATTKEALLRKVLTALEAKVLTRIGIVSLFLLFALPWIVEELVEWVLIPKGYQICEAASHVWLLFEQIVFVAPGASCINE
jgi:hypothetical protein